MKKKKNIESALDDLIQKNKKDLELLVEAIQMFKEHKEYLYKSYMFFLSSLKDERERLLIAISMIEAGADKEAVMTVIQLLDMKNNKV